VSENIEHNTKALCAIIFASDEPCDEERLASVLEVAPEEIEPLVAGMEQMFEDTPLQLVRLAGGYHLATRPEFARYVQRLREPEPERLSRQAMEVLAIAAYRQPITRPEIDEIRGVNSSGAVNSLLAKGLIVISGRKVAPGRPFMFSTTPHFLSAFGLNELEQLPHLAEPDAAMLEKLAARVAEQAASEAADGDEGNEPEPEPVNGDADDQAAEPDDIEGDPAPDEEPSGSAEDQ